MSKTDSAYTQAQQLACLDIPRAARERQVEAIAKAIRLATEQERIACIGIADEMQRMAENPHNRSATNQRQNMRLRSEARMAKSIKEKIIDRTPFSQRTPELITGK